MRITNNIIPNTIYPLVIPKSDTTNANVTGNQIEFPSVKKFIIESRVDL
jgi:hypothetical protein